MSSQMSMAIAASPLGLMARWSTRSQEQACRNAMAACTVLAARRLERIEVEEFVADYLARRTPAVSEASATPIRHVS